MDNKDKKQHIPITVRQLEAVIRLSESIAKMSLNDVVNIHHVTEAHRLFQVFSFTIILHKLIFYINFYFHILGFYIKCNIMWKGNEIGKFR